MKPGLMKLGVGSYTLPWAVGVAGHPPPKRLSALALLEWAISAGVRAVQYCDNLPLTALGEAELEWLERTARHAGVELQVGTRGLEPGNLLAHLELARRLGSAFVRLVIDAPGDEPTPLKAVQRLKALEAPFQAAGVRLALENHDRFPARVLREMLEALGTDWTGICLDTVNSLGCGEDLSTLLEHLGPYTVNVHLKDYRVRRVASQMGFTVSGAPAGQGLLEVSNLLHRLPQCQSATLELWTPLEDTLEATLERERRWAQESLEYLRALPELSTLRSSHSNPPRPGSGAGDSTSSDSGPSDSGHPRQRSTL